jgi:charged multivesicular body protein 6
LTGQVEFALVQKDVLFGLQQGTQVLQAINKEMGGIEAVDRLMEETAEARAYQEVSFGQLRFLRVEVANGRIQEVSQMLEGNLSTQDEEDVEDELEALRQEVVGTVDLPTVPQAPLPERSDEVVEEPAQEQPEGKTKAKARTPVLAS